MRRASRDDIEGLWALATRAVELEAGPTTLRRARALVEEGSVRGLRYAKGVVSARVRGTHRYHVQVALGDGPLYDCDCPVGKEAACCPHCAAVLLAWLASFERP